MWKPFEPWQLQQLQRMATNDPERIEVVMNTLWKSYPGFLEELAIAAVSAGHLDPHECAQSLGVDVEEVNRQVLAYRSHSVLSDSMVVMDGTTARLVEGHIAVWEVVRAYRRLGSVERLADAFRALSNRELAAALKYAEAHPQEIEAQIDRYERFLGKRRADYPFAR